MGWTNIFGGQPQSPADVSLRTVALIANVALFWPWNNNNQVEIAAKILVVTPSANGFTMSLPPANQASPGEAIVFANVSGFQFNVLDADGNSIISVNPGISQFVYLVDNTSSAGVWNVLTFGAGASNADAAALAGMGLIAFASKLHQNHDVNIITSTYTVASTDRAALFATTTTAGSFSVMLPAIASIGNGFFFLLSNVGTGAILLDPSGGETIDGQPTITINPGESCEVHCGSVGWYTVGRGRSSIFVQTELNKDVSGSGDKVLTTLEAGNIIQKYFGVLTGPVNVIVPNAVQIYFVDNETSGAFDLTVKTATGTGVVVPQGQRIILYCDGTNVLNAYTIIPPSSFTMADGSATTPGLAFLNDPDTGFYRPGANQLGITTGAASNVVFSSTGANFVKGDINWQGLSIFSIATVFG